MKPVSPENAVAQLFDDWHGPLLRYAGRLAGSHSSAEEVVQETFLDLYRALCAGQTVEYPKAWTMCVVRRKVSARRSDPFGMERPYALIEDVDVAGEWEQAANLRIDCERVRACIGALSPREQEILTLRLGAMKYREIAQRLGITTNSVNTHLARSLEKFRKALVRPQRNGAAAWASC